MKYLPLVLFLLVGCTGDIPAENELTEVRTFTKYCVTYAYGDEPCERGKPCTRVFGLSHTEEFDRPSELADSIWANKDWHVLDIEVKTYKQKHHPMVEVKRGGKND